jgi:hypothetical protein
MVEYFRPKLTGRRMMVTMFCQRDGIGPARATVGQHHNFCEDFPVQAKIQAC